MRTALNALPGLFRSACACALAAGGAWVTPRRRGGGDAP